MHRAWTLADGRTLQAWHALVVDTDGGVRGASLGGFKFARAVASTVTWRRGDRGKIPEDLARDRSRIAGLRRRNWLKINAGGAGRPGVCLLRALPFGTAGSDRFLSLLFLLVTAAPP